MKCPYCKNEEIVKAGKRYNKYVEKQLYRCKSCKRRFIERDGFEKNELSKRDNLENPALICRRIISFQDKGFHLAT